MYRPYKTPIITASPDLKLPEPKISKRVVLLCKILARLYLFLFYGIARIILRNDNNLLEAFERALAGKSRCIIAFRHPNGGEPQLLGWFFLFKLRFMAARKGIKFARWPHAIFVYSYEVVRWGGWAARFVMPNLGALPIHHAKMDSKGMNRINKAIAEGPYPVALAPEGQVSYTTDSVPRLEPGVIRIGFSQAERLAEKSPGVPVEILPVSIYFRFGVWGKATMEILLKKVEKCAGFSKAGRKKLPFVERVRQVRERILVLNEARYKIKSDEALSFEERLDKVIMAALETAERMMGVKSEGEFFPRMYRVRQFCWDRIILPNFEDFDGVSQVERSIMDLKAGEAWYIGRHQELIDFCWYFRVPLPTEDTAFHNKIEYVQNLWDFANRTMGGAYPDRVSIFPRKVIIQSAPVINLSERLSAYKADKKAAIATAMSDLEKAYLDCIAEANEPDLQEKRKEN
jgi:hypothetical protein